MEEVTIRFKKFTLIVNIKDDTIVWIQYGIGRGVETGQPFKVSIDQFLEWCATLKKERGLPPLKVNGCVDVAFPDDVIKEFNLPSEVKPFVRGTVTAIHDGGAFCFVCWLGECRGQEEWRVG